MYRFLLSVSRGILNNKKFVFKSIICMALFLPLVYCFTWIHELGHGITMILIGGKVDWIEVNLFSSSYCHITWTEESLEWYWLMYVMGSGATLIVAIPLFIYSALKEKRWLFSLNWIIITKELLYWATSPFREFGDAYLIINKATVLKQDVLIDIVYNTGILCFVVSVLLYFIWIYFVLYKVYKKQMED